MKLGAFTLIFFSIFSVGVNFISQLILARTLNVQDFGTISSAQAIAVVCQQLVLAGVPLFLVNGSYSNQNAGFKFSDIYLFLFVNAVIVLSGACMYVYITQGAVYLYVLLIIFSAFPCALQGLLIITPQINKKFGMLGILTSVNPLLKFLFLLPLLFFNGSQLLAALLIFLAASSSYFLFRTLLNDAEAPRYRLDGFKRRGQFFKTYVLILKRVGPFGFNDIAYAIYYQLPILILGVIDLSFVSYFTVSLTFIGLFYLLPSIFFQKIASVYLAEVANGEKFVSKSYLVKFGSVYFLLAIASQCFAVFSAKYLIVLFFGAKYLSTLNLVYIMSFAIVARYMSIGVSSLYVTRTDMLLRNNIFSTLVGLAFIAFPLAITEYGSMGVTYAYVFLEYVWLFLYFLKINKTVIFKIMS